MKGSLGYPSDSTADGYLKGKHCFQGRKNVPSLPLASLDSLIWLCVEGVLLDKNSV
jgi:hypothetical protein